MSDAGKSRELGVKTENQDWNKNLLWKLKILDFKDRDY